jgi:Uma2 family endonuclease
MVPISTPPVPTPSQPLALTPEIIYPDSDGKPISDNTKQFRWITMIQYNLDWLFAQNPQVFVAGDLLWYPVEGDPKIRQAPDVMVIFGVPKGDRGSYQQWKEQNIAPQVVFEILSPGNTFSEMIRKQMFYARYGVEEYYIYDPDHNELTGYVRQGETLESLENLEGWVSPQLGITFQSLDPELQLLRPDGTPFISYAEVSQRLEATSQELAATTQQLEATSQELAATSQQLEVTNQQLEVTNQQLEAERDRADRLAAQLQALGINPGD